MEPSTPSAVAAASLARTDTHRASVDEGTHLRRSLRLARVLFIVIAVGLVLLLGRVAQLQLRTPGPVAALIDTQYATVAMPGRPGNLLDRQRRVMASSELYYRLFADPGAIADPPAFCQRVGRLLGYDPAYIERIISDHATRRFVILDERLSDERLNKLREMPIVGLSVEPRLERKYPLGADGGQLIGFRGFDGTGKENAERYFDRELRGQSGKMIYLCDASHRPLWLDNDSYTPPADGRPVRMSVDMTIQAIAEEALKKACTDFGAEAGEMVIMQPLTGEILAMANFPQFDPNDLAHAPPDIRRNRCVTDFFEPGSIFKPFVWSAALEWQIVHPTDMIDGHGGLWVTPFGRKLHDAHGYGMLSVDEGLIKSSNIVMGQIGLKVGIEPMYRVMRAYGFGQLPGTGLLGESPGMVNQLRRWSQYSITSVPMGQEVGVTPLQITRGFCTFANGGYLIKPTLRACADPARPDGGQAVGRVISAATALHTRDTLRRVVTEGTGKMAESSLYTVWGKTGTAQMVDRQHGGYLPGGYVASFVAGAPLRNPQIVIGCFIHHPDPAKGYYGGKVAAPAVKSVVEQVLPYLGVWPDHDPTAVATGAGNVDVRE